VEQKLTELLSKITIKHMDITQAKLVLENTVKRVTDELAVLVMAKDIINDTFKPEFTSIENAQKEVNDKVLEVNIEKQKVSEQTTRAEIAEANIVEKDKAIETLQIEKEQKDTIINDISSEKVSLESRVQELEKPFEPTPNLRSDVIENSGLVDNSEVII
jgi:hypothetical protein